MDKMEDVNNKDHKGPHSHTGISPAMGIMGRMADERERCIGMTPEERAWRAQWLKDQILEPDEPKMPVGYYQARYNPIRRFYRFPMDKVERFLTPKIGLEYAETVRHCTAKVALGIAICYFGYYYFKYNSATWEHKYGWHIKQSRPTLIPGREGWPNHEDRPYANQYWDQGFKDAPI
ncbi:uncharacterized protein LOC127280647 [Leptopilina boulardi]|uniref:uncharacterized protein LOC127280647 n=1 Tax=Leptopilina boulardi TaxID=63433 RepID=UPI0021F60064|nr:uncharacterized protein LOC127280647 [Leptopilina boulardi]